MKKKKKKNENKHQCRKSATSSLMQDAQFKYKNQLSLNIQFFVTQFNAFYAANPFKGCSAVAV